MSDVGCYGGPGLGEAACSGNGSAVVLVGMTMRMRIGEVAQRAGVSVRSLRYYEQRGLLRSDRTPAGQRIFDESAVDRVRLYQHFFAAGLTSRQIAQLLPCIDSGHTDSEQREMLRGQRARIQGRMNELTDVLARLDDLIGVAQPTTRIHLAASPSPAVGESEELG